MPAVYRSEGFPERDSWFLGTLDQGSARCPELLGRRRRRRRHLTLPRGAPPEMIVQKTKKQPKKSAAFGGGLLVLFWGLKYNHFLEVQNNIIYTY